MDAERESEGKCKKVVVEYSINKRHKPKLKYQNGVFYLFIFINSRFDWYREGVVWMLRKWGILRKLQERRGRRGGFLLLLIRAILARQKLNRERVWAWTQANNWVQVSRGSVPRWIQLSTGIIKHWSQIPRGLGTFNPY